MAILGAWTLKQFSTKKGALRHILPIVNAHVEKCPGQDCEGFLFLKNNQYLFQMFESLCFLQLTMTTDIYPVVHPHH